MRLYHCELTFHDNLFYETRTLGRLYETGRLLHNIALTYALGLAQTTFYHDSDSPQYAQELAEVAEAGVYVTPASGITIRYVVNTFKYGDERNSVMMTRSNANIPTYGRAKEIAVESKFCFGVLSEQALTFPKWIRMGLWMSKARLKATEIPLSEVEGGEQVVSLYPMNPNDLPREADLKLFDLVSMRPTSLVENALIESPRWWRGKHDGKPFHLPYGMTYRFGT